VKYQIQLKGGKAMSIFETIIVIFTAMSFVGMQVTLTILIATNFSKKK
jgi:hypothetical protein